MNYPKYNLTENRDSTTFEFTSIGKHGNIKKLIRFSVTNNPDVYNLGFGNKIEVSNNEIIVDDITISNNGDRNKILATIANAFFIFTQRYPEKYVYFSGTTDARNRLYRIAISANIKELSQNFHIFGIVPDTLKKAIAVPFDGTVDYIGFLIRKK